MPVDEDEGCFVIHFCAAVKCFHQAFSDAVVGGEADGGAGGIQASTRR